VTSEFDSHGLIQPTGGAFVFRDRGGGVLDQRAFGRFRQVALFVGVGDAMPHDLIPAGAEAFGDVGTFVIDRGVHLRFDRDAEFVHHVEQAPDADAVSVVAPGIDGMAQRLVRRRDGRTLAVAEAESLDIEGHIDGETLAAGPGIIRPLGDVGIVVTTVVAQHCQLPVIK